MREQEFLGNVKSNVSFIRAVYPQIDWDAIDRADEQEDALTLGLDCMCKNNDPNCKECWVPCDTFPDEPIKFSVVPDRQHLSEFDKDVRNRFDECLELLLRKHADYGPANIANAPGGPLNGLRVRMHDKLARINHLIDTGAAPANESLRDSFLDLANYSVIALMVTDSAWPTA